MLSFGIRFGQGFDKSTILKMMQLVPTDYDYDLLVIGSSPGGVACAREAKLAGKKVGIIKILKHSPAEAEGYDEDLQKMADALEIPLNYSTASKISMSKASSGLNVKASTNSWKKSSASMMNASISGKKTLSSRKSSEHSRKVRKSRLDLNNELFKRGQHCRKLMHNALLLGDLAQAANKCGWRILASTKPASINWTKLTGEIMDYTMKENWALITALTEESIEILEGSPSFIDEHTVEVLEANGAENKYTAAMICLAMSSEHILPDDVIGALEFGITADDFVRMDREPGTTLIVGTTTEALECAGILACCNYSVTVLSEYGFPQNHDPEISLLIENDLIKKGVKFLRNTSLSVIKKTSDNKLLATFVARDLPDDLTVKSNFGKAELYDTILFANDRKVNLNELNIHILGLEIEPVSEKVMVDKTGVTKVPHIYAVGDVVAGIPEDFELSELSGKYLGKRLFHNSTETVDYSLIPSVMYTPMEYAFVGISENSAVFRLGEECVDVYYGYFQPLDFVIPARNGNCFAKIIVFKRNDTIIGIHIYGPEAGEMIQGFTTAVKAGLTMSDFRMIVGVTGTKVQEIFKLKGFQTFSAEKEQPVS